MKKKLSIFFFWFLSLILTSIYIHENPELIEEVKENLKGDKILVHAVEEDILATPGNSFLLEFSKVISFSERTTFVVHDKEILDFNKDNLRIYFQNGTLFKNSEIKKINLPENFTTTKNGGIKTVFIYKDKQFGLISSLDNGCFYSSVVLINTIKEIFKTKCLPIKKIDYNGLGSSHIHHKEKILLSIGAPESA